MEEFQNKYDLFNLHKKVKEVTGLQRRSQSNILVDKNGDPIMSTEKRVQRWKEYTKKLFRDERGEIEHIHYMPEKMGPDITREKMLHALKTTKNGKNLDWMNYLPTYLKS
ncbi:hypothetical protein RN001_009392 [Aquatica leii]|uniref:Uncharacterized protein n=1 Tax=Aquatica leii TaxID=1421715 RepID=A0AAN7S853_9COLE|nr:hypothetical protein RN001_009392 [Aquatica leii]